MRLAKSQPPALRGIKRIPPENMHVTLHFIGEGPVAPVANALKKVDHQVFYLTIENIGRFRTSDGGAIIWAGIQTNPELAKLHAKIGKNLATLGFKPEPRSYKPHITLARCGAAATQSILMDYLSANKKLLIPNIPVIAFTLYSSSLTPVGPDYHAEARFPLTT